MRTRLAVKAKAHAALFHRKTFNPSIMLNGMRLNRAMMALINAPKPAITATVLDAPIAATAVQVHIVESVMFVRGPARAVFPACFFVIGPAIITAPGDIILKNAKGSIERRIMSAPKRVSRNSAHSP